MARRLNWSVEKYKAIIRGSEVDGVIGLRSIAHGFAAAEGFDLRSVKSWTTTQRRKAREYFHRAQELQGQEKVLVRPRNIKTLRKLQESFHGDVPSGKFKVAFVPYHEPKTALPGAKLHKPKVTVLREGVSVSTNYYDRVFIPFDQKRLASQPEKEIARAAKEIPNASLYFVQTGDNQTLNGKSVNLVTRQILQWMNQYNGKSPLPKSSGNRHDAPKYHHWKLWLNGLVGYVLPGGKDIRKLATIIRKGREANDDRKRKLRNMMARKRVTKRKGRS